MPPTIGPSENMMHRDVEARVVEVFENSLIELQALGMMSKNFLPRIRRGVRKKEQFQWEPEALVRQRSDCVYRPQTSPDRELTPVDFEQLVRHFQDRREALRFLRRGERHGQFVCRNGPDCTEEWFKT